MTAARHFVAGRPEADAPSAQSGYHADVLLSTQFPSLLDADEAPDDIAAWAATVVPGPHVVGPLTRAMSGGRLSAAGRVDALTACERLRSWVEAEQLHLINQMAEASPADEHEQQWFREDIAAALRLSRLSAMNRIAFAQALGRLPATAAALQAGTVTALHARVMVDETAQLTDEQCASVESQVLAGAGSQTVGQFRQSVRRTVLRVDAASVQQRHERARDERRVCFRPVADGMEEMWALLPADRSAALRARLTAEASWVAPGDVRTADQRRADALCALAEPPLGNQPPSLRSAGVVNTDHRPLGDRCAGEARTAQHPPSSANTDNAMPGQRGDAGPALPREHGVRPSVQVTVAASTLLGFDDEPGELAGYGPIPAELARRMAADPTGTWRRLVTDDRGRLLDYGRTTYRPPADLARHVIARDRVCRFPGCTRAAARCELDHCRDWQLGGHTSADNLFALCKRHHRLKHRTPWRYERLDDDEVLWTSPTGHQYRTSPQGYPTVPDEATDTDPPF